ncbi:MAG TPA: type II toxin-antitoxin system VapC family toxin [Candidatus Baltobacteraceae bacterium]|jgi:predicted nucleic acid-binding protein|nr:type II toxin-antitoxin system VapC family toxin [Candidatus Baltobacteraceae bacterium]
MLFDTTFLIDIERETKRSQQGPARSFLRQSPNAPLFVSVISVSEFAEGFEPGREQDCWTCLQLYTVLTVDREIAWRTGQLSRQLRATGQLIGDNDLWIAATALCHRLELVTSNTHHFQRIPNLSVVTY